MALTNSRDSRNERADRDGLSGRHVNGLQRARGDAFDFLRRFVGLDFQQRLAAFDRLSDRYQPARNASP